MTGARRRTGITIKIEALRGRGPGTRRAGERLTTGGTKRTGRGTERRGKPKGRAGVEARKGSTKVERRRTGKESVATAERETGRKRENSDPTSIVVVKRGVFISASPIMTIVNIVNAEGVIALSKCRLEAIFLLLLPVFFFPFSTPLSGVSLVLKTKNDRTPDSLICCLWRMQCCFTFNVFLPFSLPIRPVLVFT